MDIRPYNENENINPETGRPVKVRGEVYLFAGTTGGGKTTEIKRIIDQIPLKKEIFDADGEYRKYVPQLNRYDEMGNDILEKLAEDFLRRVSPLWERVIVLSEAEMFLRHRKMGFHIKEIIKSAGRRGNFFMGDFHSVTEIPKEILWVFDQLYIKPHGMLSSDDLRKFSKYPIIIKYLNEVQSSNNKHELRIISRRDLQIKV